MQTLQRHNLVDAYVFLIHPLVLGTGRRLFGDGSLLSVLRLADAKSTSTGAVIAIYQPIEPTAGEARSG